YYIGIVSFTTGIPIDATLTATVSTSNDSGPTTPGTVLTSGRAQNFTIGPVTGPTLYYGATGYRIVVPQGATSLDIVLHTTTPNADVDLYAIYNEDVILNGSDLTLDYASDGATGEERITVNSASTPPLKAGTYFIALGLLTPGV